MNAHVVNSRNVIQLSFTEIKLVYKQVSILTPLNNNTRVSRVSRVYFKIQWKCLSVHSQ